MFFYYSVFDLNFNHDYSYNASAQNGLYTTQKSVQRYNLFLNLKKKYLILFAIRLTLIDFQLIVNKF